jgi:hypothetical protein
MALISALMQFSGKFEGSFKLTTVFSLKRTNGKHTLSLFGEVNRVHSEVLPALNEAIIRQIPHCLYGEMDERKRSESFLICDL